MDTGIHPRAGQARDRPVTSSRVYDCARDRRQLHELEFMHYYCSLSPCDLSRQTAHVAWWPAPVTCRAGLPSWRRGRALHAHPSPCIGQPCLLTLLEYGGVKAGVRCTPTQAPPRLLHHGGQSTFLDASTTPGASHFLAVAVTTSKVFKVVFFCRDFAKGRRM